MAEVTHDPGSTRPLVVELVMLAHCGPSDLAQWLVVPGMSASGFDGRQRDLVLDHRRDLEAGGQGP